MTEQQLIAAVLADPVADEPRRNFATWAQAHGDPRGLFTGLQLALAELERTQGDSHEWNRLSGMQHSLLTQHAGEWMQPVLGLAPRARFLRGFVEHVTMDAASFVARAAALYAAAPVLRLTVPAGPPEAFAALCAAPALARLRSLDLFGSRIGDAGALALAASPEVRQLTWLDLGNCDISRVGLEALIESPNLTALCWLGFTGNQCENPSDRSAGIDEGRILDYEPSVLGAQLEARHGERAWLHFRPSDATWLPPPIAAFR